MHITYYDIYVALYITVSFYGMIIILNQGQMKLFITGQAKFNPEYYVWVADNFTTDTVIRLIGLKVTLPLCLLLSFLHNRIPCKHDVWAADNLASLDILFLSIIA